MSDYSVLLIGVPTYKPNITPLPFCANDVLALQDAFKKNLGIKEENIRCLGLKPECNVTKAEFLRSIKYISENAHENETIIFYFSGHGFSSDECGYLATSDTEVDLPEDTGIPIERLRKEFSKSKAKTKLLIIDSCYSGIVTGKNANLMTTEFEKSLKDMTAEGWIIFASCKGNETSSSLEDQSMSVFTFYLLEALKGKGIESKEGKVLLSFENLTSFVTKNVTKWAVEHQTTQTPNYKAQMVGTLSFEITRASEDEFKSDTIIQPTTFDRITELCLIASLEKNNKDDAIAGVFTEIIKFIKPSEIDKRIRSLSFPFGCVEITNKNIVMEIIYPKIDDKVQIFLSIMDYQYPVLWDYILYKCDGEFDFDRILEITQNNGLSIHTFNPETETMTVHIGKNNRSLLLMEFRNKNTSITFRANKAPLENEFFDKIPIDNFLKMYLPALVENKENELEKSLLEKSGKI